MEINSSTTNPLIGIANLISAVVNGRYSKDGIDISGAAKTDAVKTEIFQLYLI